MQTKPLGHNKYGTNKYHITHTHYKNYLDIFSDEEGNQKFYEFCNSTYHGVDIKMPWRHVYNGINSS